MTKKDDFNIFEDGNEKLLMIFFGNREFMEPRTW